ncbi:MAG: ABC transporter transmembrane domain-containing protein, partial [Actinomycetota bacterium]|nr:ABC transporter transmembrane domain-containing protein [Actinomycetota bacterium]
MSEGVKSEEEKAAEARRGPTAGAQRQRGPMGMAMPGEKSQDFLPSAKRLLRRLRPERSRVGIVLVLAVVSVALTAIGPKILGAATNLIFEGFIGRRLPAGATQDQVVAGLRAQGDTKQADLISGMNLVPGQGIDFTRLGQILLFVLALYALGALLQWASGWILAGVVTRTTNKLRADVEDKLNALPLPYFDGQPRGELLSRVTNDVDNVQQSLQQTLSQLLTSLLTVVAVVALMFSISWTLALIALVTIPISMALTAAIAKRSQKLFVQQWKNTGQLNGIIEETFTGHGLVKVFGRQKESQADFDVKNDELYKAAFGAQFISGIIMPAMMFIGNLNYVVIAVLGGLRVASGTMTLGDVQAFIQYSRQFTQPLTQVASMANLLQSGVASAERVFEVLDAPEQDPDPVTPRAIGPSRGRVAFEDVTFSYTPDKPLIEDLDLVVEPGQTVAIVGPTGAGKTTLVNLIMRFYELSSGRITLDGVDVREMTRHDLRARIGMVLQDTWLFAG